MLPNTPTQRIIGLFITIALLLPALLVGCGRDAASSAHTDVDRDLRIVTLAPGLTQMLVDLDLADSIVGVAEHDAPAPPGLPVVGNYADVHTERLLELAPTHVLTLTTAREAPQRLRDLAAAGQFELVAYPFPYTIDEVRQTLHRDAAGDAADPPPLGELLDVPGRARQLSQRLRDRLEQLRALTADREQPNVLMVIGVNPIMASGPGTVHDELLTYMGARNAARDAGVTAPTYDREALVALAPDVVLLLQPDARPLTDNDPRMAELRHLPLPAVRDGRVYLIHDPLTLLASTSLSRVAGLMAEAIHPDLAEALAAWRDEQ